MNKQELLQYAYPLGKFVSTYTAKMAESGYQLCEIYQNDALSYAEGVERKENLRKYWAEIAVEDIACTHQNYNPFTGKYPKGCLYKSDFIAKLRERYPNSYMLEPSLSSKYNTEQSSEAVRFALHKQLKKQIQKEIKEHSIAEIADFYNVDFQHKKQLLYDWFVSTGESYGFFFDKKRSTKGFPVLTQKNNTSDFDVICFISTLFRYEISSAETWMAIIHKTETSKIKDLYKNLNQYSPLVELKPTILTPGFECYYWSRDDIKDVMLSVKASLQLFKIVSEHGQ